VGGLSTKHDSRTVCVPIMDAQRTAPQRVPETNSSGPFCLRAGPAKLACTNKVGGTVMSTPMVPARTSTGRLNKLAVVAIIFAVIAASGFWVFGVAVLAVFAVGAGHVALNQILLRDDRGRGLAIAALVVGYGIATLALINTLGFISSAVQQISM
jgi:hypothetical protein